MLPCRATPRTREKQRAPGPRHQPRPTKVWNQPESRERNRKEGPHPRTALICIGSTTAPRQTQHRKACGYGRRDISKPWYGTKGEERAHTRRQKCEGRYVIRRNAARNVVPTMHNKGPHTPTLPLVLEGATREKAGEVKDRDTHEGGGREKRECQGEGRAEERKQERTNETRGRQQPSKGRGQGRGHGRHTAHGGNHTAPKRPRGGH